MRCTVIDDLILVPEREEAARIAREKAEREARERAQQVVLSIISGMVQIPGKNYKMGKYEGFSLALSSHLSTGTSPNH